MSKYLPLIFAALLIAPFAHAQDDTFGLWTEAGITKRIDQHFSFEAGVGYRANDNLRSSSRFDFGLGINYKPVKGLKMGVGYVLIDQHNPTETKAHYNSSGNWNGFNVDHSFWRIKNRFYADVSGKIDVGRFSFGLRERYQATVYNAKHVARDKYRGVVSEDYADEKIYGEVDGAGRWYALDEADDDYKEAKTKQYLRSRISVEYNIRHCNVDPFASVELSNSLDHKFSIDKRRWTLGADWKITKKHTVTVAYVYTNGQDDDDEGNLHALSIGYNYKF